MDRPRRENAGSRSSSRSTSPGNSTRPSRSSTRRAKVPSPVPSEAIPITPEQMRPSLAFAVSPDAPSTLGFEIDDLRALMSETPPSTGPRTETKPTTSAQNATKPKKLQLAHLLKATLEELHYYKAMDATLAVEVLDMPDHKKLIQMIINKKVADEKAKGDIANLEKLLKESYSRLEQAMTHLQAEKARAKHAAQQAHLAADKEALRVCPHPSHPCA